MFGYHGKEIRDTMLPAGLVFHCEACRVVVPVDAPRPESPLVDCAWVARNRMAPFKPGESMAGKFTMAAAAWALIHQHVLKAEAHAESAEYHRRFKHERKAHFADSALRKLMTPAQIAADKNFGSGSRRTKRDAWLYEG
jgi:hypothetical protein